MSTNLAITDMMLQQALVGSTPNMLILSYFKHTICSKVIHMNIIFDLNSCYHRDLVTLILECLCVTLMLVSIPMAHLVVCCITDL